MLCFFVFFFFSSRRRHTRWTGDWSSDVYSSDLPVRRLGVDEDDPRVLIALVGVGPDIEVAVRAIGVAAQIGRASCRERVWISVGAVAVKEKRGRSCRWCMGGERQETYRELEDDR